jgi:hypothetical protein
MSALTAPFLRPTPHIENEWPNSRPISDRIYADIPEDDKRKTWAGNKARSL